MSLATMSRLSTTVRASSLHTDAGVTWKELDDLQDENVAMKEKVKEYEEALDAEQV